MKNSIGFRIVIFFIVTIIISSCKFGAETKYTQVVDVMEFKKLAMDNPDIPIIDVRTPAEFNTGHVDKAINVDVTARDFVEKVNKLDKEATYLIYCRSGKRSKLAAATMEENGFTHIYEMKGGYLAYAK